MLTVAVALALNPLNVAVIVAEPLLTAVTSPVELTVAIAGSLGELVVTQILPGLGAKDFRTGSRGYWAGGKLVFEGKRYQAQVQLVEIGSKTA